MVAASGSQPREDAPSEAPPIPAPGETPLEERLSFLVHRVNAQLAQVANRLFRVHDLDLFSSRILVCLLERREMRVGELVEFMLLPQSTISHQLQRLEKRKLIRRRRTREDNRFVAVALTPLGATVARDCNQLSLEVYDAMTGELSPDEVTQLRGSLGRMLAALATFQRRGDAPAEAEPRDGAVAP